MSGHTSWNELKKRMNRRRDAEWLARLDQIAAEEAETWDEAESCCPGPCPCSSEKDPKMIPIVATEKFEKDSSCE